MTLSLPESVVSALQEGRQAYIAVSATTGPHVTPELYCWSGGKLWSAMGSSTLKAKVVARDHTVGVLVGTRDRCVLLQGEIEVFDPRRVATWPGQLARLPESLPAVARYTARNAPDLLAFAADLAAGRLGRQVPPLRLLTAFQPARAALIEGDAIVGGWGSGGWAGWSSGGERDLPDVPVGGRAVVVGLPGPVAAPGRWYEDDRRVYVSPDVIGLMHAEQSFPLSIVVDEYSAPGPAAKRGALVHGQGHVADDSGYIEVEPARTVSWSGVNTTVADAS